MQYDFFLNKGMLMGQIGEEDPKGLNYVDRMWKNKGGQNSGKEECKQGNGIEDGQEKNVFWIYL